ncbi:hypothetical protein EKL99_02050 [Flavobacterium sp. ZB4P23]|uniref:hypothetical protein n=1 Tax=Flavobacterium TaxID=237 RepID=UPI000F829680|nr:hypothetical protein [Flavobacterium sp. ZB4P23]RTY84795.1 hypothetical protein EKL99_02050 [Flavobacterium sp. ZB4P23]
MNILTKYFFSRCFELLNKKSFDTYRVSLHNPYTIFEELLISLSNYDKKRIKNYDPTITSIGKEIKIFLDIDILTEVFEFNTYTKQQVKDNIENKCIKGKEGENNRTISLMCKTLLEENKSFTQKLFIRITELLLENVENNYHKVDRFACWLISQLLYKGYSRKFISNSVRKANDLINSGETTEKTIEKLSQIFEKEPEKYGVIFKIKSENILNFKFASQELIKIEELPQEFKGAKLINSKFKILDEDEVYLKIEVNTHDFWSALKLAHKIICETIEINILHQTDNKITLENQALVFHDSTKRCRMEKLEDSLDGYYDYNEDEFSRFIFNYKNIESTTAREKLRSAIRFYKLGNDSIEMEHKILNYWIGFEQLFSAINSNEDSIKRIKNFYVALSCCYYLQRRVNYLLVLADSKKYTKEDTKIELQDLKIGLMEKIKFEHQDPLLEKRLSRYINDFNSNHKIKENIELHQKRLDLHLTRIYKIRNELVHEGKTSVDLNQLASHLRHYLLFSIEQITNELNENIILNQLDDVFIYFENLNNRIINAKNIEEIFEIKEFKGYME